MKRAERIGNNRSFQRKLLLEEGTAAPTAKDKERPDHSLADHGPPETKRAGCRTLFGWF
jgi:hypothetical protein